MTLSETSAGNLVLLQVGSAGEPKDVLIHMSLLLSFSPAPKECVTGSIPGSVAEVTKQPFQIILLTK